MLFILQPTNPIHSHYPRPLIHFTLHRGSTLKLSILTLSEVRENQRQKTATAVPHRDTGCAEEEVGKGRGKKIIITRRLMQA